MCCSISRMALPSAPTPRAGRCWHRLMGSRAPAGSAPATDRACAGTPSTWRCTRAPCSINDSANSGVVTTASTAVNATDDSAISGVATLRMNRRATVQGCMNSNANAPGAIPLRARWMLQPSRLCPRFCVIPASFSGQAQADCGLPGVTRPRPLGCGVRNRVVQTPRGSDRFAPAIRLAILTSAVPWPPTLPPALVGSYPASFNDSPDLSRKKAIGGGSLLLALASRVSPRPTLRFRSVVFPAGCRSG